MSLIWLNSLCPFINVGRGRDGNSASALSNTRCRQMVSKILIFWKWVLPWLCLISAFQTPTSYKWNDTCPFAFYAVNRVLRFGVWQSEFGFQIVIVSVFRHNNLLQNQLIAKPCCRIDSGGHSSTPLLRECSNDQLLPQLSAAGQGAHRGRRVKEDLLKHNSSSSDPKGCGENKQRRKQ